METDMTGWDLLDKLIGGFPPVALTLLLVASVVAAVMCVIGFGRHGMDFIKHGFKQTRLDTDLDSRFNTLASKIDGVKTELDMIKVNHFGHLKKYLGVLNGILLDKGIIDNESRARLDNELMGM
jgi:hypothetical protein